MWNSDLKNILKTRLVSSDKYKPSFLSQLNFLNVPITRPPKKYYFFLFLVQNASLDIQMKNASHTSIITAQKFGKISAQPHTTLRIQFLDRENHDKNNTLPIGK